MKNHKKIVIKTTRLAFITILMALLINVVYAQDDFWKYEYYNTANGLSQNTVYAITQDTLGYMWFGTQEGLNRFDGKNFKIYRENPIQPKTIKGNWITSLLVTKKNQFFVGTRKALNKYDHKNDEFLSCILFDPVTKVRSYGITSLAMDSSNRLWVGTENGLSFLYIDELFIDSVAIIYLKNHKIKALEPKNDSLWIATDKGLFVLNLSDNSAPEKYKFQFSGSDSINVFFRSSNDTLYAGTNSGRRYKYNPKNETFTQDRNFEGDIYCMVEFEGVVYIGTKTLDEQKESLFNKYLSDRNILSMFSDMDNNLWIGTYIGGINRLISSRQQFRKFMPDDIKADDDNIIRAICESHNDILFGTTKGTMNSFDVGKASIGIEPLYHFNKSDGVYTMAEDSQGILWIGTGSGKIYLNSNSRSRFDELKEFGETKHIHSITYDSANTCMWVGSEDSIYMINEKSKRIQYRAECKQAYHIFPDPHNQKIIWVGSLQEGLKKLTIDDQQFIIAEINPLGSPLVSKSLILDILQDKINDSILWFGSSNGLIKFNKQKSNIDTVLVGDEVDKTILSILPQNDSIIWLHTTQGRLIRLNSNSYELHYYSYMDGLQKGEGVGNSRLKSKSGWMLFGGTRGFNYFHPESIIIPKEFPKLFFTEISSDKIDIVSDNIDEIKVKTKVITFDSIIKVKYRKGQTINIGFVAIDFFNSEKIHYWGEVEYDGIKTLYDFGTNEQFLRLVNPKYGEYKITIWSSDGYSLNKYNRENKQTLVLYVDEKFWERDRFWPIIIALIIISFFIVSASIIAKQKFKKKFAEKEKNIAERNLKIKEKEKINIETEKNLIDNQKKLLETISSLEKKDKISEEILKASIELFGFDYASVSFVDYYSNSIKTEHTDSKNKELVNPDDWKDDASYNLNDKDILCRIVRNKEVLVIHGDVNNLKEYPELNRKIFEKHNHHELNRIFVPIFHSEPKDPEVLSKGSEDIVIGVIEAGYHKSSNRNITDELKQEYEFFVNASKESIYRAYRIDVMEEVEKISKMASDQENHKTYFNEVLDNLIIEFDVEIIEIFLLNFDDEFETNKNYFIKTQKGIIDNRKPLNLINDSGDKGIVRHVLKTGESYHRSVDIKNDPRYLPENENTLSELALPLKYQGIIVGVINIESFNPNYFNNYKESIIEKIFEKVLPVYYKKKLDYEIQSLIKPFVRFSKISVIHKSIVGAVKSYFSSDLVCLWAKDNKKDFDKDITSFSIVEFGTDEIKTLIGDNTKAIILNPESLHEISQISLTADKKDSNIDDLYNILHESELSSVLLIPISQEGRIHGFVSVFSRRNEIALLREDRIYLKQISLKAGLSMSYASFYETFSDLGEALTTSDQNSTVSRIMDGAYQILNPTNIVLINYNSSLEKYSIDFEPFGDFSNKEKYIESVKKKGIEDKWVINRVIKENQLFLEPEEYVKFLEDRGSNYKSSVYHDSGFGYRERIKSMVAVTLKHENELLGILFINYNSEQTFSPEFRSLIYTFKSMASSALANIIYLDKISTQKKELALRAKKLEFEYEEIYNKMKEMAPLTARTSFYLILEGMNHDIRNIMIRMKQMTFSIKSNYSRMVQKDREEVERRVKDLDRGIGLISDLLVIFDFKKFKLDYVNTSEVIHKLITFFKNRTDYKLAFVIDLVSENDLLHCYKAEFSMIFYNLINNSVYAIREKGKPDGRILVSSKIEKNNFIFIVEDNGTGIPNEIIDKIYLPGFTKKESGLGIGLFFVKDCVNNSLNGEIDCESSYGNYTRFIIKIPKI